MRLQWMVKRLGFLVVLLFCVTWLTFRIWSGQSVVNALTGWNGISQIENVEIDDQISPFHETIRPNDEELAFKIPQTTIKPAIINKSRRTKWLLSLTTEGVCGQRSQSINSWQVLVVQNSVARDARPWRTCHSLDHLSGPVIDPEEWHRLHPLLHTALFAIQNGARHILVLREKKDLSNLDLLDPEESSSYLSCKTHMTLFDPYVHFLGQSSNQQGCDYKICKSVTSRLVAPAVFYIGGENSSTSSADHRAPQVTIKDGTFTHFGKDLILFPYESFWALPAALSIHNHSEQTQAWSLAIQHLLWLCGVKVTLMPPVMVKGSFPAPLRLPNNTDRTLQFLDAWSCDENGFYKCLFSLADHMIQHQLMDDTLKREMISWIDLIKSAGYSEPEIRVHSELCEKTPVNFYPVPQPLVLSSSHILSQKYAVKMRRLIYKSCVNIYPIRSLVENPKIQFRDVLLIIVFNNPHYSAIPFLETLYRSIFPYILYCGPTKLDYSNPFLMNDISFITYDEPVKNYSHGAFNYQCLRIASQLKYSVTGYLVIADDLIFNPWNVYDNLRSRIWYPGYIKTADIRSGLECRNGVCDVSTRWRWWSDYRTQVLNVLNDLKMYSKTSSSIEQFYKRLVSHNQGPFNVNGGYADVYYIPTTFVKQFSILAELFYKNEVFLEIAVPTIISMISEETNVTRIDGFLDWYEQSRHQPWKNFGKIQQKAYFHPWKLGNLDPDVEQTTSPVGLKHYCNTLLKFMHDYGRIPTEKPSTVRRLRYPR